VAIVLLLAFDKILTGLEFLIGKIRSRQSAPDKAPL
jgi:hypothetical protein